MTVMFHMEIAMAGAAFDDPGVELARLLDKAAQQARDGQTQGALMDVNGNRCGTWHIEEGD